MGAACLGAGIGYAGLHHAWHASELGNNFLHVRVLGSMTGRIAELPEISTAHLFRLPAHSTLIITVNNRLARRIGLEFAQDLRNRSLVVAELPAIVPLMTWIRQAFDRAGFAATTQDVHYLLDPFATQMLWSDMIRGQEDAFPLLDIGQAAAAAMEADALMLEWGVDVQEGEQTPEHEKFISWRNAYTQRLRGMQALDSHRLFGFVTQRLQTQAIQGVENIVFAGFSETSPRLDSLTEALAGQGLKLSRLSLHDAPVTEPKLVCCQTPEIEWRQAVYWARSMLQAHPEGRFAIVAANLERVAPFARRVLHNMLDAQSDAQHPGFAFNVAVGRPLADWPAGRAMLAWLSLFCSMKTNASCDVVEIGNALLAGHCKGHLAEMGRRAALDARVREKQFSSLSLEQWTSTIAGLERLSSAWEQAWQIWQGLPAMLPCDAWADAFRQSLSLLGFPGDETQDSVQYQATEALSELFDRLVTLTPVLGSVTATDTFHALSRLCRQTLFQPQRDPSSRLDVLGLLEAEGGSWDGVWVLGLTDEVLPAAPKPNPFMPVSALRRANAPRSTPERELEWARQLFESLSQTAPQIWVSYPKMDGERELRPSPLIAGCVEETPQQWIPPAVALEKSLMETLDDQVGPRVSDHDQIVGGVSLLETQSRNPLWAFVRHRLNVRGLNPYARLPSKTLRGVLIHGMLEQVWSDIHSRDQLRIVLGSGDFTDRLHSIAVVIASQKLASFPAVIREMEIQRACELVMRWLQAEAERTPFQVLGAEREIIFEHAPLALKMRLDRLDVLSDGRQVVIDYKTGSEVPDVLKDWTHPRPVQVQLLAYADQIRRQAGASTLAAMVLAHLHPKEFGATGVYGSEEVGLAGLKSFDDCNWNDAGWDEALDRLSQCVQRLADEFCAGMASNVSWRKNDLQHCDVLPILRCFDLAEEDASDE